MPRKASVESFKNRKDFYAQLQLALPNPRPEIGATIRLLSGCQQDELSWGNATTGRFTAALKQIFADGSFQGNYKQFHADMIKALSKAKNKQTPGQMIIGADNRSFDKEQPFKI